MKTRKTTKHEVHSLEEKRRILELYLSGEKSEVELAREYDLDDRTRIYKWLKVKDKHGELVDLRGRDTGSRKGRPKSIQLESMSRDELIKHIRMIEDIKKSNGLHRTSKSKYLIIERLRHRYSIARLCRSLRCSRSGYYAWVHLGRSQYKAYNAWISSIVQKTYHKDPLLDIRRIRISIKRYTAQS